MTNTIQEVVDEAPEIVVRPNEQHYGGGGAAADDPAAAPEEREFRIRFGQIFLSKPLMTEADGETATLFPKEARLRNVTYSAPMYVDISLAEHARDAGTGEMTEVSVTQHSRVFLAKVRAAPSFFCVAPFWGEAPGLPLSV